MKNKRLLAKNSAISLLYQIISVVIGLLLPRLILIQFGSEINGVITSISQMLSVISVLDLGVGAVVQAALYKPLAHNDEQKISLIYSRAYSYFRSIAEILLVYIVCLCVYYGVFKHEIFSWIFTTSLVLSIAISYFAQYFFGICNTLLLNADQKIYVVTIVNLLGLLLNAAVTVLTLKLGCSIQIVKLSASIIYLLKPVFLEVYVKKHYQISLVKNAPKEVLPNQWSGLSQHVAAVLTNSIDSIVLTLLSPFSLLSVYHVYVMPLNSIKNLFDVTSTSYKSYLGSIIAKDDQTELNKEFDSYEIITHYIVMVVMITCLLTLIPFVLVYTEGVDDVEYYDKLFCVFITLAYTMYALRLPYTNVIFAAGKFKETQKYSIVECLINLLLSFALVKPYGLTGVAIGTVVSSFYRMVMSADYLKKDVLFRPVVKFGKILCVDVICIVAACLLHKLLENTIVVHVMSFKEWIVYAIITCLMSFFVCTSIYLLFYYNKFSFAIGTILRGRRK